MTSTDSFVAAWTHLNKQYASRSHTRVMSLKERLALVTKGISSVNDYIRSIRVIGDELTLIGHPIDDIDLVIAALNGLKPSFYEFSATIRTRDSTLMFNDLYDKVIDFEIFLNRDDHNQSFPVTTNYTHRTTRGYTHGHRSQSMSSNNHFRATSGSQIKNSNPCRPTPVCKYCHHIGYTIDICYRKHGFLPHYPKRKANFALYDEGNNTYTS
ncbi:PREDICTED: uncharacterized protein LOC109358010 [Lupinus angustifolius]|uniref:uncharacterized protein LOC109358010 n=1 Tax=Lupinus angustifolius TaxID=3871 RepID=UPI00092FD95C|nr:PREDICTED: uncharacterized protein LOC109358010 [Lupinus angustifolius]